MSRMADKLGLDCEVRELKLGASFSSTKASQYHTIKYDFKPASVDASKMATVDVGTNNQVTVTVPSLDGAGVPQTVFKGNQRPYTKECVLIIDRVTGEITLEKLSTNIQVKKTRQEWQSKARPVTPVAAGGAAAAGAGAAAAAAELPNMTARSQSRTRVTTSARKQNVQHNQHGGAREGGAGANRGFSNGRAAFVRSPPRHRTSPPQAAPWSAGGQSTMASLPMIGLEESAPPPHTAPANHSAPPVHAPPPHAAPPNHSAAASHSAPPAYSAPPAPAPPPQPLPQLSMPTATQAATAAAASTESSSSSSSGSDSDSDSGSGSDSDDDAAHAAPPARPPHHAPDLTNGVPALPADVLNDDLCLSESGSDSD